MAQASESHYCVDQSYIPVIAGGWLGVPRGSRLSSGRDEPVCCSLGPVVRLRVAKGQLALFAQSLLLELVEGNDPS